MKNTLLFKALLGIWGALSFQCVSAETTFTNIEESEKEYIVDLHTHDELQLSEDLSGYRYEVNLTEPIDHALHLYFAYTKDKNAEVGNNTLTWVNGGIGTSTNPTDVYIFAAFSADSDVYNNTLNMEGGEFYPQALSDSDNEGAGKIAAAKSDSADMYGNKVVVTGGVFHSYTEIIGAYSNDQSDTNQVASYNRVVVEGTDNSLPSFKGEVVNAPSLYGAKLHTADVHHNWVKINSFGKSSSTENENISVFQNIVGGQAASGNVSDNRVEIVDSQFYATKILGGYLDLSDFEEDRVFNADGNAVFIDNSEIHFKKIATSFNSTGSIHNGTILISNTTLHPDNEAYILGGDSWLSSATVSGNTIHLIDVKIAEDSEGPLTISAGGSDIFTDVSVVDNTVILESLSDDFHTNGLTKAIFLGHNTFGKANNNTLVVRKWKGNIGGLEQFDSIAFTDFKWKNGESILNVLGETDISSASLKIDVNNIRFDDRLENHFGE